MKDDAIQIPTLSDIEDMGHLSAIAKRLYDGTLLTYDERRALADTLNHIINSIEIASLPRETRLKPHELFAKPKSLNSVVEWIELHDPMERPHLLTAAMMAWNVACHFAKQESLL